MFTGSVLKQAFQRTPFLMLSLGASNGDELLFIDFDVYLVFATICFKLSVTHQCISFFGLFRKQTVGTSLLVQGLRICLAMQGTQAQSLVREVRSHLSWGN